MENKKQKIHFIGIGGIGFSALARYYWAQEAEVSGSDATENEIIEDLRKVGAKIPPSPPFIKGGGIPDLVIYSAAVRKDNPELVEARRRGIKCQKYAEALGELTKQKYTIAVSGIHGKSTTTAMIGLMMERAGLDPTVIVGTKVREWGDSNCRVGKSRHLVIEADEYDRSFLNYWPKILVLLNIEEEHLDTYTGGLPDIMKTFGKYVSRLPEDGTLIVNEEDINIAKIKNQKSKPQLKIQNYNSKAVDGLNLKITGQHNVSNANAALAVARVLGIDEKIAIEALNNFSGTWRRMEYRGLVNGAKIYDDYGHHPTEIKATLAGARELVEGKGKLWCVFQPHQYQRTYKLFDRFVAAFDEADKLILLPIYSVEGREDKEIKKKVSSEKLAEAIKTANSEQLTVSNNKEILYMKDFNETAAHLRKNLGAGDVCVIMGAGDINQLTGQLIKKHLTCFSAAV